jgi:hypothetical protein
VKARALAALLLLAADAPPAPDPGWMAGTWREEKAGRIVEEQWSTSWGGAIIGTSRSGKPDKPTAFEFMRIAPDEKGVLTFYGAPGGKPAVAFPLIASGSRELIFENPAHDAPQRVRYRREGDVLIAEIAMKGGTPPVMRWRLVRSTTGQ